MSVFIRIGSPDRGETQVAPLSTAREQLDSALRAELEAPPSRFGESGRDPSGPVLVFFAVLLVVLVGIRRLQRMAGDPGRAGRASRLGTGRSGLPASTPDPAAMEAAPDGADERGEARRPVRPRRKKPEPIPLPPHVAAMLARIPGPGQTPEAEPDPPERAGPAFGGLDVRIG